MINTGSINTYAVNNQAAPVPLGEFAGGTVIQFEQTIVYHAEQQTVIQFEQTVEYHASADAQTVIQFEQTVNNRADQQIVIQFEQTVKNLEDIGKCFISDWDLVLTINGAEIPHDQIVGTIEVVRSESDAALLSFELKPELGIQDFYQYQGKKVTLDVIQGNSISRIYTGIIDYPTYNLVNERVLYRATDRRRELVNSQLKTLVKSIGYYTNSIFGEPIDTADELDKRLTTVPLSLDFDAYGNYTLTSILAKSTPDFILSSSDIFRRTPTVELASRARLINKVTVDVEYRYNRLHQQAINFNWPGFKQLSVNQGIEEYVCNGAYVPRRDLIESAADGSDWKILGKLNTTRLWDAGWVSCGFESVAYSPFEFNLDTGSSTGYSYIDWRDTFAIDAQWIGAKRWAQTLSENYSIVVQAPQSISQYGVIEQERSYGVESTYDSSEFEESEVSTNLGKYEPYATQLDTYSFYIDYSDNRTEFNESYLCVLNIAKTTIISTHRDNRVTVEIPLSPEYDLKHTVQIASNKIDCVGKISRIAHKFNISEKEAYSEVELSMSKSIGSPISDTSSFIVNRPTIVPQKLPNVFLQTHLGEDPSQPGAETWTGWIGNKYTFDDFGKVFLSQYPMAFIVKGPDVLEDLRESKAGNVLANYQVNIQDDDMDIVFTGSCG